jgi:Ser/Thr protein kinase RdoA (MazF antagonist)
MDDLLRAVAARSADLGVAPARSGLVVGMDRDPSAKVTVLLFDASGRPAAVAKLARQHGADAPLRAEYDALAALAALAPAELLRVRDQIPRALLLQDVAGRTVLVTSAVPGGPTTVRYHAPGHVCSPSAVAEDLSAAGGWLAAFQEATTQGSVGCVEAFETYAVEAFDRYRAAFGPDPVEHQLRARSARLAQRLTDVTVPLCAVHGDFALGNVLLDASGGAGPHVSGVVDWELGRPCGPGFTDLFKFVASYGSFLDRAAPRSRSGLRGHPGWGEVRRGLGASRPWPNLVGFLYAFSGSGWFPVLVREYLAAGYRRLGVPAEIESVFLPAFVAQQATTLADPVYRQGYRDLLHALAAAPWRPREAADPSAATPPRPAAAAPPGSALAGAPSTGSSLAGDRP